MHVPATEDGATGTTAGVGHRVEYGSDQLVLPGKPELIEYFGYPVEVHHVTTSDGYVLELHRIPRGINETEEGGTEGKRVAYLQHCLLCSSSDWIMGNPDRALETPSSEAFYFWGG
ncbi:hypothetical protein Pcinc_019389 [Petrolisthes cinctipes]|uniref:Partial AB-hydrolase lipase domain-containing protein n=1 Tax=Petrolisthes cinctipes TaxID=88211 RepID=A0AAE1FLM2_PETCI|nr:hypothetical protein Pcinc_019389 [Petrolisthes cinctipes]